MRVLICGGGIIGACAAYYLSRAGAEPVVIERTGLACAASGKSGGFLALDWCDGTPLQDLARRSYALHAELAQQFDGTKWGYRALTTYSGVRANSRNRRGLSLDWLSPDIVLEQRLGTTATTAQVHPERFTAAMMQQASASGAELLSGEVQDVVRAQGTDEFRGVLVDGKVVEGDAVLIAMGPWSHRAADWMPLPPVIGYKGHSLIFNTGAATPAEALFLEVRDESGVLLSPEVVPRPDGTTWVCAISSTAPLPADPAKVSADAGAFDRLEALARTLSPMLAGSPMVARQACFRPVTMDGLPLIGAIAGSRGRYVASGHSVWGILNAPATGEAIAELILDGRTNALDLSAFAPDRLR